MVEKVQCPVCTLFLHAGMNLSDHLETHPKEQVIKALVQMTLPRLETKELPCYKESDPKVEEDKIDTEPKISKNAYKLENYSDLCINSNTNSIPSISFSSSNLPRSSSLSNEGQQQQSTEKPAPAMISNDFTNVPLTSKHTTLNSQNITLSPAYIGPIASTDNAVTDVKTSSTAINELPQPSTDFSSYTNRSSQHYQQSMSASTKHQQLNTRVKDSLNPVELVGQQIGELNNSSANLNNFHSPKQQHRQQLQLPPSLQVHQSQHVNALPNSLSLPQQQNLKVIYSPALPLSSSQLQAQVFNYQFPAQQSRQKPPPAYGTAISQIRSQHNQIKKGSQQIQQPQQQQQPHQQHLQQQQQLQHHVHRNADASISKQLYAKKNPLSNGVFPIKVTQNKQHQPPQQQCEVAHQHQQQFAKNVISNSAPTSSQRKFGTYQTCSDQSSAPTPANVSSSTEMLTLSSAVPPPPPLPSHTSLHSTRHAYSPYPSSLSISSSSCSSVLRYAESPVTAHYLERDNGDFIVQETPKRIVECVEKDNGEFSVIERIYQSPPSVLRIHDEDEDNAELEVVGDTNVKESSKDKKNQLETSKENDSDKLSQATEEELMRVDDRSEAEKSICGRALSSEDKERNNNIHMGGCSEKPTTSAAAAAASAAANGSNPQSRRKSPKNTITVLSDVQLNLNEYLDLVGNIIASSKIPKSQTLGVTAPIPLVKVEKVEPMDEYEEFEQCQDTKRNEKPRSMKVAVESINDSVSTAAKAITGSPCTPEPPNFTTYKSKENTSETDEIVENNFRNKTKLEEGTSSVSRASDGTVNEKLGKQNANSCSGHATTSVIRMATTTASQQYLMERMEEEHLGKSGKEASARNEETESVDVINASDRLKQVSLNNSSSIAEDLSPFTQIKSEALSTEAARVPSLPPPQKKGPKKLVIKPKSSTVENKTTSRMNSNQYSEEQPTSLSRVKMLESERDHMTKHSFPSKNVIKSEPNTSSEVTNTQEISINSFELKQEKSSSREESSIDFEHDGIRLDIKNEREELNNNNNNNNKSNVSKINIETAEDQLARSTPLRLDENTHGLLDFPSSSKTGILGTTATTNAHTFPSANSIFGVASSDKSALINSNSNSKLSPSLIATTSTTSRNALATLRCEDEFIIPDATDAVEEIVISSCYSSQSASDVALNNFGDTQNHQHHQQQQQNFTDYPFSFLYGGSSLANEIANKSNFAQIYQQQPHDITTAATLASGSNSTIEEYSSDPGRGDKTLSAYNHHDDAPSAPRLWYQSVSTSNAEFEASLAVDCGAAVSGDTGADDAGSYLDLDSYKRVNMIGGCEAQTMVAPSSSLSSFTAATESSLAGCTTDALNIRTDEKMPAKGEISEQESNCDIDNSWSQSIYGDIPVRFFKSSFPGLMPGENCWNNEEYFTVQDLSASAGTTNISNRATKSFDFRLPSQDAAASSPLSAAATSTGTTTGCSSPQHQSDNLPSTSSKKKRKRELNEPKNTPTAGTTVMASTSTGQTNATATVTSQDLLLQREKDHLQQHQRQLQQIYQDVPTTSAAMQANLTTVDATPPNSAQDAALNTKSANGQSRSGRVFSCIHCIAKFSRLRDRNLHMIALHNYVLRNYRLVPVQKVMAVSATAMARVTTGGQKNQEIERDSKQDIVKLEVELTEQIAVNKHSESMNTVGELMTKSELDEKDGLSDLAAEDISAVGENSTDPVFLPSLTRLYNLYHMLISFNIAALKQNQTLSEADEKLMLSSIFFCFICRQKFGTVKLYDAHMTEHPAECYTCGKKFHRWQNLSLHLKRHLGWKEFGCNICDKKFVVRSALVEHMRMHTGQKPLKCNICDKHFKRFSNLAQHRKRHGKQIIRKKEFVCHCGEVLPSKARFLWHKETHDAKPKCCQYCCDRFVHANSLRRHIRLAHSDKFDYTEPMECPMCKQVFAKSSIRAHMAIHSMDMQHVCSICSKSFSTKWNLKIHSWVHANRTAKPFKCEHCPKAFVREVDFKNHINAHKQIKPYTCEYCGCKFIRKYNYLRHRREHHGNKKFTCDLCKKSFHRHYYLIEHRRIHTGERPFQCTICGKSSTTKTNHNKHLKIHHSRDPFTVEA